MSTLVAIQPAIQGLPEAPSRAEVRTEVTPEELLAMPDGGHYELIDGELRERNLGALSNLVAFNVGLRLGNHCNPNALGWLFAADQGYQCFPDRPRRVRRADVSFIRRDRYSLEDVIPGFRCRVADLFPARPAAEVPAPGGDPEAPRA